MGFWGGYTNVDDAAKTLLAHIERSALIRAPSANQVDVDDLFHLCIGQLPSIAKVDDTGVGNDHIQTTKGLPCRCKKILLLLNQGVLLREFGSSALF